MGVITIGIDPELSLGPLTVAWHGVMIAVGIVVGAVAARRYAGKRGLRVQEITDLVVVIAVSGIVGARLVYLLENDAAALLDPTDWLGTRGFSFYGAIVVGVPATAAYLHWRDLDLRFLDALAFGFPFGMAVGRIGDLINGEHFGPASELPWAIRYSHSQAEVPSSEIAYHSGGLYEIVLALLILPVVLLLADRLRRPGTLLALVVALYSAGRFLMFFVRSDSDVVALGLSGTQLLSLALLAVAAIPLVRLLRHPA